jgi:hypothetical protein
MSDLHTLNREISMTLRKSLFALAMACVIAQITACSALVAVGDAAITVGATAVKVTAKAVGAVANAVIPEADKQNK